MSSRPVVRIHGSNYFNNKTSHGRPPHGSQELLLARSRLRGQAGTSPLLEDLRAHFHRGAEWAGGSRRSPGTPGICPQLCAGGEVVRDDSECLREGVKEQSHRTEERPALGRW